MMVSYTLIFIQSNNSDVYDAGYNLGYIIGSVIGILIFLGIILGLIFLVRYIIRKARKTKAPISRKKNEVKTVASAITICANCNTQNSSEARYCSGCGFEMKK